MAASDAIPVPRKGVAFRFYFAIRKPSDSTLITTWAGQDSEVSLDGAAYSDCTNEATEIGTSGTGYIDLTAAEMNADCVLLKVTVTNTGAVPLVFVLYPETAGDYRVDVVQFGGTNLTATAGIPSVNTTQVSGTAQTAGDIYASQVAIAGYIDTEVSAIKAKTDNLPADPADQSAVEAAITAATSPLATQASVNTIDDFLDTEIAAIKTKTDQLTFTTANKVDSTAELDSATQTQIDTIETNMNSIASVSREAF